MKRSHKVLGFLPFVLILAACSEDPKPAAKKEPPKPPEPISAQSAFFQMYRFVQTNWAPDVEGLTLRNIPVQGVKPSNDGKAGAWQAAFVSQRLRKVRPATYSVLADGGLHKGPYMGLEQSWSGPNAQAAPFNIQAFKVDATAALETAKKQKQTVEYMKKNPDKAINFLLAKTPKYPNPAWRVIWGDSVQTSNFSVYVDASTGDFLEIAH